MNDDSAGQPGLSRRGKSECLATVLCGPPGPICFFRKRNERVRFPDSKSQRMTGMPVQSAHHQRPLPAVLSVIRRGSSPCNAKLCPRVARQAAHAAPMAPVLVEARPPSPSGIASASVCLRRRHADRAGPSSSSTRRFSLGLQRCPGRMRRRARSAGHALSVRRRRRWRLRGDDRQSGFQRLMRSAATVDWSAPRLMAVRAGGTQQAHRFCPAAGVPGMGGATAGPGSPSSARDLHL